MNDLNLPPSAREWLKNGEKGISSQTIFSTISGLDIGSWKSHPSDPDDFNRCYKLIKQVPEWEKELSKVAELSDVWKNIIDNWSKLCSMLEEQLEQLRTGKPTTREMYLFMESIGC